MSDIEPPLEILLAKFTAEALALPHRVCRRRNCRRKTACCWYFTATGEPFCLRNLTAAQRLLFDELYDVARRIRSHGGWNGLFYASPNPAHRALQDVGMAIARNVIHSSQAKRWHAFRRQREALKEGELAPDYRRAWEEVWGVRGDW